jgi:ATP-dependent DNA helicase RecG
MAKKKFEIGKKYTPRQLMELAVEEMEKSIPDPNRNDNKPNPKVGAVIATQDGILIGKSHRGELRIGDHAEFTAIERHHRGTKLDGYVIYATLEPCAPGARNHPKLSCAERITNARIAKVYIGAIDPDPSVAGEGRDFLKANNIEIDYFDSDLYDIIYNSNKKFFDDAKIRANDAQNRTLTPTPTILTKELQNFDMTDFSEEAQQELVNRMNLNVKVGSEGYYKFLLQLGLLHRGAKSKLIKPTGLGLLLLGRNPQVEFEQARIKFTIEQSVGDARIKDIEGPILLMPEKAESLLDLSFLPEINRENFHRDEIVDISKRLLRELIVNAIVHRDYTIKDKQIRIVASKEKIEVWSPGEPIVHIEKFRTFEVPSISRNPKLAYVFFKTGLVEERGIGMKELKSFKDNNQLEDPDFRMEEGYFVITVHRKKLVDSRIKKSITAPLELKDDELKGYEYLKLQKRVSKKQYAEYLKIDEKKAQRQLVKFKEIKLVKQEGKGPATEYVLIAKK